MYPTDEETSFWINLNRAQMSLHRKVDLDLKAAGLPPLRWYDVMWALERADTCGVRPYELVTSLIFEQSNLSRLLRRLVDEGLAEQMAFDGDRRGKVMRITAKGQQVRKEMWKIYGPILHASLAGASDTADFRDFTETLKAMIART